LTFEALRRNVLEWFHSVRETGAGKTDLVRRMSNYSVGHWFGGLPAIQHVYVFARED
jgi:hypothetical protein